MDVSNSVSILHFEFVRGLFSQATIDVALFVDQNTWGSASVVGGGGGGRMHQQHVFPPFFDGSGLCESEDERDGCEDNEV
jgi:hypothetical protein